MQAIDTHPDRHLPPSELVLRPDGSIYHLGLHPEQIADTILIAGDPGRVELIASYFDKVEHRVQNREFVTITGTIGAERLTAMSTGIGTDNIDIVINELDALVNIDLKARKGFAKRRKLRIVRIGTSGALHGDIDTGSYVHSCYAIGLDGVMHFYNATYEPDELALNEQFKEHTGWDVRGLRPYAARSDRELGKYFDEGFHQGITVTACGFYGPQGRVLRLPTVMPELNDQMSTFSFEGIPLANYEMESSALFALGGMLGHQCTTVCLIIANRIQNAFLKDYKPQMKTLVETVIQKMTAAE